LLIKAGQLMDRGAIGAPRFLRSTFSFFLDRAYNVRWDPALGGGALWDVGCYPMSISRYFFGAPERVQGWQVTSPSGVDETFVGTLYFPGQRVAQIDCSFRLPYRTYAEVVGESGSVVLTRPFHADAGDARLLLRRGDEEEPVTVENRERYLLEIEDMHECLLTGKTPLVTPAETRGHIETILDLYASAKQ